MHVKKGGKILLVDDEEPLREVMAKELRDAGYVVVEAGSGVQAVIALTKDFELLLTDIRMAGNVSGGDLADGLDSFLSACSRMPVDHCEADKGPFFGGQFGTTVGMIFGSRVRARFDLGVERYFVKAGERKMTDGSLTLSSTSTNFATRFWALAGLEL